MTQSAIRVWRSPNEKIALRVNIDGLVVLLLLLVVLAGVLLVNLMFGSYPISMGVLYHAMIGQPVDNQALIVLYQFRLPRSLVAASVGAMLALSGALLQRVTRNPLADPSIVGISQGAGLAVVAMIAIAPNIMIVARPWVAMAGSLSVAILIQLLSAGKENGSIRFILMGIGLSAFISALMTMMLTYSDVKDAISALAWLAGSVNAVGWLEVKYTSVALLCLLPVVIVCSRLIAVQALGTATAIGLGVPVRQLRRLTILLAVALAALPTAVAGPIAFVGLIAPHLARQLSRSGYGMQLIHTAVLGAVLVVLADVLGRNVFSPIQIPAGLICAVIGVPVFMGLMLRNPSKRGR